MSEEQLVLGKELEEFLLECDFLLALHEEPMPENFENLTRDNPFGQILRELIAKRLNQIQIGKELNVTQSRVSRLISEHKYDNYYFEMQNVKTRKTEKQRQKALSEISLLIVYGSAIREGDLVLQKALEYKYFKKPNAQKKRPAECSLEQLQKLFTICYSGEQRKLEEISEETNMSPQVIGYVLKKANVLRPYKERKERTAITEEQEQQIERAKRVGLSKTSTANLLNLCYTSVNNRMPVGRIKATDLMKEIFEAQDLGFNPEEISELTGLLPTEVNNFIEKRQKGEIIVYDCNNFDIVTNIYSLLDKGFGSKTIAQVIKKDESIVLEKIEQRSEEEPKIIYALSVIFDKEFEKPYL